MTSIEVNDGESPERHTHLASIATWQTYNAMNIKINLTLKVLISSNPNTIAVRSSTGYTLRRIVQKHMHTQ